MRRNKKKISVIMLVLMILSCNILTSCKDDKPVADPLDTRIRNKLYAYTTDLDDSSQTLTDNAAIADYLRTWANAKSIEYTSDEAGNVIMTADSSMNYYRATPTVIVCPYDALSLSDTLHSLAVAMYIIKNNEDTGKLSIIFTPASGNDFSAAAAIDKSYFPENCSILTLSSAAKSLWGIDSGAYSAYTFTGGVTKTAPSGDVALTVEIKNVPSGVPDAKASSVPNAIKTLGSMLATFKTNAQIFELASISGGTNAGLYPSSASVTIVVSKDYAMKFKRLIGNEIDRFSDTYSSDYPDVEFSYAQTVLPDKVFDQDSQNRLIGSLYSLIDGVYSMNDNDDVTALTNIGTIATNDTSFVITAVGCGNGSSSVSNIDGDFSTICAFSGITYAKTGEHDAWQADKQKLSENGFISDISDAYREYSGDSLKLNSCVQPTVSYDISRLTGADMVNIIVNESSMETDTGAIITYLMNKSHDQPSDN